MSISSNITYAVYLDPFTRYEAHTVAEIATIIIADEPGDLEIEMQENGQRIGLGYYDSDGEQITPRIYKDEELRLNFPEEYWEAQGLSTLINAELAKQLAA
jgi:hypothetical protein